MTAFPSRSVMVGSPDNIDAQAWLLAFYDAVTGLLGTDGTPGAALSALGTAPPQLAPAVASGALTVSLLSGGGGVPTANVPLPIVFRSPDHASGASVVAAATAATPVVVSNGSTLGMPANTDSWLYFYAVNDAGAVSLAVTGTFYGTSFVGSTVAEGGAGAADSATAVYGAAVHSGVAMTMVGKALVNQATAGDWTVLPSQVVVDPRSLIPVYDSLVTTYPEVVPSDPVSSGLPATSLMIAVGVNQGFTPTTQLPVEVVFRASDIADGSLFKLRITSEIFLEVTLGSTLGTTSGVDAWLYVYLANDSGTVSVAVSGTSYGASFVGSTTAEGGAGGADSGATIYSASALTDVPMRYIGKMKVNQATAGDWTDAVLHISVSSEYTLP